MTPRSTHPLLQLVALTTLVFVLGACKPAPDAAGPHQVSAKHMADALLTVIQADRTVYAREVVHRLQNVEDVIQASEHWKDDKALPLPAQMFRMGAELALKETDAFSYSLLSLWPINPKNAPRTEMEEQGLKAATGTDSEPFYGTETLGKIEYFVAVYPDVAVSAACIKCHNAHQDSPRDDFELGDTMGGIVIRIPVSP